MSHSYGRAQVFNTLAHGGTVYFTARSDMSTLFDDLALVRPTTLSLVPRICEMVFHRYLSDVDRYAGDSVDAAVIEQEVKTRLRESVLGGRVLSAMLRIGAAARRDGRLHGIDVGRAPDDRLRRF